MKAYSFEVTCWACGGTVEQVNAGAVIGGGETKAIVRCTECGREWGVHVRMISLSTTDDPLGRKVRGLATCGTDGGYKRHMRRHEPTCPACKAAHAAVESARVEGISA